VFSLLVGEDPKERIVKRRKPRGHYKGRVIESGWKGESIFRSGDHVVDKGGRHPLLKITLVGGS